MKILVLVSALCFFLKVISTSKSSATDKLNETNTKFEIGVEMILREKEDNIILELLDIEIPMDEFLKRQLCKNEINKKAIVPVLQIFESWLKEKTHPVADFAKFIKLYDPSLKPEEQGSSIDTFKTQCLWKLVKLAYELKLNTLLMTLSHPFNAPCVHTFLHLVIISLPH